MTVNGRRWDCRKNTCYFIGWEGELKKPEADEKCHEMGAHIVALETEEENNAVVEFLNEQGMLIILSNIK